MKKLLLFVFVGILTFSCVLPVSAATINTNQVKNNASFEITDVLAQAQDYGIGAERALTRIPINLEIGGGISTDLVVDIAPQIARAAGTKNFTVSGNFYRTSDNVVVSVYGLSGSFEYTGSDTKITGKSSYHNSTADKWTGTSRTSTSKEDSYHISVLKGDYTLFYDNKENNSGTIKIAVADSGVYSVGGDYASYTVN